MYRSLVLSICLLALVGCKRPGGSPTEADQSPKAKEKDPTEPFGTLDCFEAAIAWSDGENHAAIEEKYFGKWWLMEASLVQAALETDNIGFSGWSKYGRQFNVRMYFVDKKELATLKRSDRVKIKGLCKDAFTFTFCRLVPWTSAELAAQEKKAKIAVIQGKINEAERKVIACKNEINSWFPGRINPTTARPYPEEERKAKINAKKLEQSQLEKDIEKLQQDLKKAQEE